MRVVDEVHLEMPYAGARKTRVELRERTGGEIDVTRHCVSGLMEEMNVRPVYPKPNLSKPAKKALKHPYLLKNKAIRFPNQVWSIDITYVPIGRSHMYLTCVIDWYSRYVVGWRLASDMGAAGVCECARLAFEERGEPAIMNSDQGSVFNSAEYEGLLAGRHVLQSMDGKARWVDNVIVERWFRSLKSECLRLGEYETPAELRRLIRDYVDQYNNARRHQSLGYETPAQWYHSGLMAA
jgi:putative transposase